MGKALFWPTVFAALGALVLIGLGIWQLERLVWKRDLVASMDAGFSLAAVDLPEAIEDPGSWSYRRVRVSGTLDRGKVVHLYAIGPGGRPGYRSIAPLLTETDAVLVLGEWSAEKDEEGAPVSVTIEGVVRLPSTGGVFTPANNPAAGAWYSLDLEAMARHLKLKARPVFVETGGERPVIANDHLEYALTWFALAATLIAVYAVFVSKTRRRRDEPA